MTAANREGPRSPAAQRPGIVKRQNKKDGNVKAIRYAIILAVSLTVYGAAAQDAAKPSTGIDSDIALLRANLQAQKTDIITKTMSFDDAQGKAFWPLYREYSTKQQNIGDQRVSLIKDYADNYQTMDDARAQDFMNRLMKFEQARSKLAASYWPKFKKAIGAKQAAKFYQVENRLRLVTDLQIASSIPIIQ